MISQLPNPILTFAFVSFLSVTGKPQPVTNCTFHNETASSVDIACSPGYDGGLAQVFLLELYSARDLVLLQNLTNAEAPSFTLSGLGLDGAPLMRVVISGVNAKGRSPPIIWDDFMMSGAHFAGNNNNAVSVGEDHNYYDLTMLVTVTRSVVEELYWHLDLLSELIPCQMFRFMFYILGRWSGVVVRTATNVQSNFKNHGSIQWFLYELSVDSCVVLCEAINQCFILQKRIQICM